MAGAAARTSVPTLPAGFHDQVVVSGLDHPTAVRFAPDGTVFVAEQGGKILELDGLGGTPRVFADLSADVDAYWDRGLLGLAVDPGYPNKPYVYALYAYDAPPGGTAPTWNDGCPTPPGPTTDGCVVQGRLVRLTANASGDLVGSPQVLVQGWCQQFPSHSVGDLEFGSDGALYASGGEGASFLTADYGQLGGSLASTPTPVDPCGDPPNEGGSLRAQSPRWVENTAVLSGSVIRIDPVTGNGLPGNPMYSAAAPSSNRSRIVAYGLRNPFRFTFRPGTNDLWLGDVGEYLQEEIDHLPNPTPPPPDLATNFGWPCYEGPFTHDSYLALGLPLCAGVVQIPSGQPTLDQAQVTAPYFAYNHYDELIGPNGECDPQGQSSITGVSFYANGDYPAAYDGALFFADHTRNCIWAMLQGAGGNPDPANVQRIESGASNPVDLESGPDGDIYYVDLEGGAIHRITSGTSAFAIANQTSGDLPLTVTFDGSGSSAADGKPLTYSWSFGDGTALDTSASPTHTFTAQGTYTVRLTVKDDQGTTSVSAPITINAGNTAPIPTIVTPSASTTWSVGQTIDYSGSASDRQDPASSLKLTWTLILHHCITPTSCHTHLVEHPMDGPTGSFTAPDHGYPSYLELQLAATDTGGLTGTTSIRLDPVTAPITVSSVPSGARIFVNGESETTPFTSDEIVNSTLTLQAPSPQTINGRTATFSSWSNNGPANQVLHVGPGGGSYTATFALAPLPPPPPPSGGGGGGGGGGYPDLNLAFAADATTVAPGATVRLEATVANTGLGGSTGDTFALALPAGVTATLAKSDRGPGCAITSASIDCNLDFTSTGMAAHIIMLLAFPTAGTYAFNGLATSGFPTDSNLSNNSAAITILVRDPSAPLTPPPHGKPAKPTFTLTKHATRVVQVVKQGRYLVATLTARVAHATSVRLSAERRSGGTARAAQLAAGTTVGGVRLARASASVACTPRSGQTLVVRVRIARSARPASLWLRFAVVGAGGRLTVPVSLHAMG